MMKTMKVNYALSGGAAYLQDEQDYNKILLMVERDFNRIMSRASIEGTQMDLRVDAVMEYEDRLFPLE